MSDRLDACELLSVARQTLLEKLLPSLPKQLRYEALMIANAMAIARRECQLGAQAAHDEMHALQRLSAGQADEPSRGLETARRQLAGAIREGHYDTPGPGQDELLDALERVTLVRLAISNPKVLARDP